MQNFSINQGKNIRTLMKLEEKLKRTPTALRAKTKEFQISPLI
ncbi:hypothetical protein YQE_01423, partial [Dendroctonus ponderosae]